MDIKELANRIEKLERVVFGSQTKNLVLRKPSRSGNSEIKKIHFNLNERNFIRTYAGGLSGHKKFTLLLAHIVKGKVGSDVELSDVRAKWNKMTAKNLMGYEFNLKYPNEAKTRGWLDSKKSGVYCLCDNWMDIFN